MKLFEQKYPAYPKGAYNIALAAVVAALAGLCSYCLAFMLIPDSSSSINLVYSLTLGLMVFFILSLFQIGLPLLLVKYLKKRSWTLETIVFLTFFQSFLIVVIAYIMAIIMLPDFELGQWLYFFLTGTIIAILWLLVITLPRFWYLKRHNEKIAGELNDALPEKSTFTKDKSIQIHELGKAVLNVTSSQFLFLERTGQFVYAHYLDDNGIRKILVRRTLKSIVKDWDSIPDLVHCHQDYIVNLQKVKAFYGDAQGLFFIMENVGFNIPITQRFIDAIKKSADLINKN